MMVTVKSEIMNWDPKVKNFAPEKKSSGNFSNIFPDYGMINSWSQRKKNA